MKLKQQKWNLNLVSCILTYSTLRVEAILQKKWTELHLVQYLLLILTRYCVADINKYNNKLPLMF